MSTKSRQDQRNRKKAAPKGYDYGIKPRSFSVGSLDFLNNLSESKIDCVAYGYANEPSLGKSLPVVSLVGRNPGPLSKAFQEFAAWAAQSDGDAVELVIVFLESGGYKIGICPEITRLLERTMRFDTTYEPMAMVPTWIKQLDSAGPQTLKFKDYKKRLISPFLLGAAWYDANPATLQRGDPPRITPIGGTLLKFEASIVDENYILKGSQEELVMRIGADPASPIKSHPKQPPKPPKPSPLKVRADRATYLRRNFPVTLARIERSERMKALKEQVLSQGVDEWQFEQAVCNLVMSRELTGGLDHFEGVSAGSFKDKVAEALAARYEVADDKDTFASYTTEAIMEQVYLDARFLLREFGDDARAGTLTELMQRMKKLKLLNPRSPER
ncbi:hypothetical protein [Sorangium sp. So ce854]|uniref:hypothetical protein n=1 Tax=Sorangium sp. So ce854 TaxID=3133322 RepID=UPI003F63A8F6